VAEEWGPCSSTCGDGIRKREVKCKIFLEFSRTIANLPDKECPGPKPSEEETCHVETCHPGMYGPFHYLHMFAIKSHFGDIRFFSVSTMIIDIVSFMALYFEL
jgi:hypothetical protein